MTANRDFWLGLYLWVGALALGCESLYRNWRKAWRRFMMRRACRGWRIDPEDLGLWKHKYRSNR